MTQTQTSPDSQQRLNEAITAAAVAQLASYWPQVDWASPAAVDTVKTIYQAIVTQFGQAAASVAANAYDEARPPLPTSFRAVVADPVPRVVTDKAVTSAFLGTPEPIDHVGDVTTSDLPVDQRVPARLENAVGRHVLQPGRDTTVLSATKDPAKPLWARKTNSAKPCAFCVLLASRTFKVADSGVRGGPGLYLSESSALFKGDGQKYHTHCSCTAVPVFSEGDLPPSIRDHQDMYRKAAADAGRTNSLSAVLSSMRQLYDLK